jgi:hypothetical protein
MTKAKKLIIVMVAHNNIACANIKEKVIDFFIERGIKYSL